MFKLKSKKIMFVVLMGIIACLASLFICFGQNAYADEEEVTLEKSGYIVFDCKYQEYFKDIHELEDKCNKYFYDAKYIEVTLEKDLYFDDCQFHIDNGRTFDFNLCGHKIYKNSPSKNAFFWVAGTLNLNGEDPDHKGSHATIEGARGTTNASVISDKGHINANYIDFISKYTKGDDRPYYASHLYFTHTNGKSEIKNCKFTGGCGTYGASIYSDNNDDDCCSFDFEDCVFENCESHSGAIDNCASNSTLSIENTTFKNCNSESFGGAIENWAHNSCLNLRSTKFENCSTEGEGGAIYYYSDNASMNINDTTFENCHAECRGGTIYVKGFGSIDINNTKFESCTSDKDGGALYNGDVYTEDIKQKITFDNCTINKCKAHQGGAIYDDNSFRDQDVEVIFNNTNITNCESKEEGGAIYATRDSEKYYFNNSTIESCHAGDDGGAIFVYGSKCKFIPYKPNNESEIKSGDCLTIKNCKSDSDGGAIYTSNVTKAGNDTRLENIKFIGNKADENGGGVCANGRNNEIIDCLFRDNYSADEGGGLYQAREMTIDNCEFQHNTVGVSECTEMFSGCKITCHTKNRIFYLDKFNSVTAFGDMGRTRDWIRFFNDPVKVKPTL